MTKPTTLAARLSARWAHRASPARRKPTPATRPRVEPLEDRALLSIVQPLCNPEHLEDVHVLTNEHTDLNVFYSERCLGMNEANKSVDPIAYYPAGRVILEFLPGARRPQTSDPRFAFLGAGPGNPVWIVPISPRDPNLLQLGVSGEQLDPDTFASYIETDPRISHVIPFPWIKLSVVDVRGRGYFSVWQTDDFGSPTVWVATSPGGNPNPNVLFTVPGGHIDYNWAFSAPGDYQVDLRASGFLEDSTPVQSRVTTYHFQVDDVPANRAIGKDTHHLDALFTLMSRSAADNPTEIGVHPIQSDPLGTLLTTVSEAPNSTQIDQAFGSRARPMPATSSFFPFDERSGGRTRRGDDQSTGVQSFVTTYHFQVDDIAGAGARSSATLDLWTFSGHCAAVPVQ